MTITIETMNKCVKTYLPAEAQQLYVDGFNKAVDAGYDYDCAEVAAINAVKAQYEPPRGLWVRRTK